MFTVPFSEETKGWTPLEHPEVSLLRSVLEVPLLRLTSQGALYWVYKRRDGERVTVPILLCPIDPSSKIVPAGLHRHVPLRQGYSRRSREVSRGDLWGNSQQGRRHACRVGAGVGLG